MVSPAGVPIGFRDLRQILFRYLLRCGDPVGEFTRRVCQEFGVKNCFVICSGRAALCIILQALRKLAGKGKNEVIVPAYTCFSVAASVVRAGLKLRLCDVNPFTLDFDYEALQKVDFSRVLCLVSSNLLGLPNNLPRLTSLAKKQGIFLVDDACQAMGAKIRGKPVGTFGDVGFFSLDRGKNITAMGGGIIVTSDPHIAHEIGMQIAALQKPGFFASLWVIIKLLTYFLFLRPSLYWIPHRLPFLKLGQTFYEVQFPISGISKLQAAIALQMMEKLEEVNRIRAYNARTLIEKVGSGSLPLYFPQPLPGSQAVFLRLPVLIWNRQAKEWVSKQMAKTGICARGMYPCPLNSIREVVEHLVLVSNNDCPNAKRLSGSILTLPTHPYVSQGDIQRMSEILVQLKDKLISVETPPKNL